MIVVLNYTPGNFLLTGPGHADIVSLLTLCPNLVIDIRNLAGLTVIIIQTCSSIKLTVSFSKQLTGADEGRLTRPCKMHKTPTFGRFNILFPLFQFHLGNIRQHALIWLQGASPVLRDFGRGLCAAEWARLTARPKCAEIIDKYMEKMQLNPGLGLKSLSVGTSEPSLIAKRSSLVLLPSTKTKDSWV